MNPGPPLALDTPVSVYEYDRISGEAIAAILQNRAGPEDDTQKHIRPMVIAVIIDNTPLAERDRLLKDLCSVGKIVCLDRVEPNPRTTDIMTMFEDPAFQETNAVLGIGGGSVMDSAKALAMLATNGGTLEDHLGPAPKRVIERPSLPLVLIPTTAGTGSEVTKVGGYSSAEGRKYTLGSPARLRFWICLTCPRRKRRPRPAWKGSARKYFPMPRIEKAGLPPYGTVSSA
jgi:hypothetical protein